MKPNGEPSVVTYFRNEKKLLILTSITGIIYNVGMTAGPWFEGQLAQYLFDILKGVRQGRDIIILSLIYVLVIAIVQGARALKRLYVRKFANNVTRSMKESIYHHLVHEPYAEAAGENTGAVMTRAIADAEACAEGMRKFTTEIFDTGVVMIAYLVMLFLLDWRLTLIVILFPPIAYAASAALKGKVTKSSAESKAAMSRLNSAAVDCAGNALTYRIYGEEQNRGAAYEEVLSDYEHKNVAAGVWQNSPQPVYLVISMIGVIPILLLGGRNVLGSGWIVWTIASFSSFLSCFTKLATKSSHAAKLFNAVQKARVSWQRIRPYLSAEEDHPQTEAAEPADLVMEQVGFTYPDAGSAEDSLGVKSDDMASEGRKAPAGAETYADSGSGAEPAGGKISGTAAAFRLHDLNFQAHPGEIIGITGRVASGKSTFGRLFLNEYPHEGRILYGGKEISGQNSTIFAYEGHDPELFTGTVRENVAFGNGDEKRLRQVLAMAQIDGEVTPDTQVGKEGSELSGGQQQRIALARALYSKAPVLILDDPFSAVDLDTEQKIFRALLENEKDRIILVISHRMELFPEMDQVLFLENGTLQCGTHQEMMHNPEYASLYALQNTWQQEGSPEVQQGEPAGGDHR